MAVNDEGMAVPPSSAVKVRMVELQVFMGMLKFIRVFSRPDSGRDKHGAGGEQREHPECRGKPDPGTEPSCRRICDEPAGMRESELGREQ
jgi:hypothetical protein